MGFRFQKRIKLLPGVSVNLSKSGISTSVGPRGAKITVGHGKIRKTVGLPGTGLSHTTLEKIGNSTPAPTTPPTDYDGVVFTMYFCAAVAFIVLLIWLFR